METKKQRDPWVTDSRLYKFRDPTGELGAAAKRGASIEELRAIAPGSLYRVEDIRGNIGLTAGIIYLLELMSGIAPSNVKLDATHAVVGVGNSNGAASADQTELEAERLGMSAAWVGMDAGFPLRDGTTLIFRASFLSGVALFDWLEWAVAWEVSEGVRVLLNRKVETVGTKPEFDLWIFETGLRWA